MAEKNKQIVEIAGMQYTLAGDSSPEHMKKCAKLVNDCIEQIQNGAGNMPKTMVAVLAACNIADDYLTLQQESKDLEKLRDLEKENAKLLKDNTQLLRKIAKINNAKVHED